MKKKLTLVIMPDKQNLHLSYESFDERVYLVNTFYSTLFGLKFKDQGNLPSKRGVIKISIVGSNRKIYRLFAGGNKVSGSEIGLTGFSMQILGVEANNNHEFIITKASWFRFMWNHPMHSTRIAYRISIWAILVGLLSIILTIIPLIC